MKYIGMKLRSPEPKRDMKKTAAIFPLCLGLLFLIEVSENDLANLKVIENAPTPGGPVVVTQEELEAFRVEATQEELEAFKDVESSSSPGDPATFSAEELESVKPADNRPSSQETGDAEVK